MSTVTTWQTTSIGSSDTEQLAEKIGAKLHGGEVIELISDLGGGKTTFVRGLARGMGSTDRVASPTFTISKIYRTDTLEMHHFDFYRLPEAGMVAHELAEVIHETQCVVVVEWAGIVQDVLPEQRITIVIKRTGEDERTLLCSYPARMAYLFEGVQA